MKTNDVYLDLAGCELALAEADAEERLLIARLRRRARTHPDWIDFSNYRRQAVLSFYDARGLPRKKTIRTLPYLIAQDLSARLGIAAGFIQPPDYRDKLEGIIRTRFRSQKAFCKKTGLDEALVGRVLDGRADLSVAALATALERIGLCLDFVPASPQKQTG